MDASRIPIRNVYYMLCYAWNYLPQAELVDLDSLPGENVLDLLAMVLVHGVEHLARRGMEQGYQFREDDIAGVRGRINLLRSERRFLPRHGKAACSFDELSVDTISNQIVKSTLRALEGQHDLDSDIRRRVHLLRMKLVGVSEFKVTAQAFRRVQLHGNNRYYRFLLSVCRLIHCNLFVDSKSGETRFYDFVRDERVMSSVFQNFLYHFASRELGGWRVGRSHVPWSATSETDPSLALLPRMETDITLKRRDVCVIVDAKYYQRTLATRFGGEKFYSENLYQLLGYLTNYEPTKGETVAGMLVYPQVDRSIFQQYRIKGFEVTLRTVDLNQTWTRIHDELVEVFRDPPM